MDYDITAEPGYLRARLSGRETVEETREFIHAVVRENQEHNRAAVLIDVHASRPVFHSESGLLDYFKALSRNSSCMIALLGDTADLRLSHEYLALLARQQGLNVWSFRTEAAALKWLTERHHAEERRNLPERREPMQKHWPITAQRRIRRRRFHPGNPEPSF